MQDLTMKRLFKNRRAMFVGQIFVHVFFIVACLIVILPVLLMFMVSFTDEVTVMQYGYSFFPKKFSLDGYRFVFQNNILNAYGVSILVTVTGTVIALIVCSMCAFTMCQPTVKYRNVIAKFLYFPTLFNAGLIPWYLNITTVLNLGDSFWVLVLPTLVNAYNIFLLRNYFKGIPYSLIESARMDGAGQFRIYAQLVMPLSGPIIATVGMFIALAYWNDWYLANWFIQSQRLYPLQYYLFRIQNIMSSSTGGSTGNQPLQTGMVAGMFITIGPIIILYPFVQRFFVKGITVGAVKG